MHLFKICKHHGELHPDNIRICNKRKSAPVMICLLCSRERTAKSYQRTKAKHKERKKQDYERNRDKYILYSKNYRENNKEKVKLSRLLYGERNKEKVKSVCLKLKFGINIEKYNEMLNSQNGVCAICNRPETAKVHYRDSIKNLAVDHNHDTGKIRGLLCGQCNRGLGCFEESIESLYEAIKYIKKYN